MEIVATNVIVGQLFNNNAAACAKMKGERSTNVEVSLWSSFFELGLYTKFKTCSTVLS